MNDIVEKFSFYMEHSFVRYALIVGVLIALCSSLLGVTLVLKRFSFIGDGLSHTAFGAMAGGSRRTESDQRYAFCSSCNSHLRRTAAENGEQY